jgi:DNA helicase-2/ATP-dependent DNA helicase PcrA
MSTPSQSFLTDLNEEQLNAVTASFDVPLFIYAGAGSGKTRTLICRITQMISQGISPSHILAITFTRKAADEIRERLRQFVGPRAGEVVTCTFHQLCLTILRQHPFILNFSKPEFRVADPTIQQKIVKNACVQLLSRSKRLSSKQGPALRIMTAKMLNFVRRSKTLLKSSEDFEGDLRFVLKSYEDDLKKHRLIDFSDFLTFTERLLKQNPRIAYEYGRIYEHILVDEFQDTCSLNFSIIKLILGKRKNLTIVGDVRQSIYGFRGANPTNVARFFEVFPEAHRIVLSQNYRSTETILNAAQSLISHNVSDIVDFSTPLISRQSKGDLIKVITARDSLEEVELIAQEIERLVYPGSRYQYRDIVVMFRVRRISSDIEMELFRHNIPYTHKRGLGFFMRRDVREVLAYTRLALSYEDDNPDPNQLILNAVETVINVPDRGIGAQTIQELKNRAEGQSLLRFMINLKGSEFGPIVMKRIQEFTNLIRAMHKHICVVNDRLATDAALQEIVKMSKMLDEAPRDEIVSGVAETEEIEELNDALLDYMNDKKETIELLFTEAKRFHGQLLQLNNRDDLTTPISLVKFINALTLEGKGEVSKNAVALSTVHQMKGLEAPVCFLMRFNQGVLPVNDGISDESATEGYEAIQTLEEERRIAYVAMTRAKEKFFISWCLSVKGKQMEQSQFLAEIEQRCLTKKNLNEEERKEVKALMAYVDEDFEDLLPVYRSQTE